MKITFKKWSKLMDDDTDDRNESTRFYKTTQTRNLSKAHKTRESL